MTPKPDEGMGINEYARHRRDRGLAGKTRASVQKAIADGRLAASVAYADGHPRIRDVALADQEWAAATRSDRVPLTNGDGSSSGLIVARTRRETALAEIAEMEAGKMRGDLVQREQVITEISTLITQARNRLLGVPSKMKQRRPHLEHGDVAELDELIRDTLEELAEGLEHVTPETADAAE